MAVPSPSRPDARRRRPRWPLVAAALVLLLIGRGVEWLPGGPEPTGGPGAREPGRFAATEAPPTRSEPRVDPGAAPAGEPASAAVVVAPATDTGPERQGEALDADRFGSWLHLVRELFDQGQLGAARASLQRLAGEPLDTSQRREVEDLATVVAAAAAAAGEEVRRLVAQGFVLRAQLAVARLVEGVAPEAAAEVERTWRAPFEACEEPLPQPAPLPRNRRVRLAWRDGEQVGTVAQSRSDQVTVRLTTALGQSYPTVPVVACEPVDATPTEAIEMAWAAVHAGEPTLARLWLLRARATGDGDLGERGGKLARLLGERD